MKMGPSKFYKAIYIAIKLLLSMLLNDLSHMLKFVNVFLL
jgi:hypothetical protein